MKLCGAYTSWCRGADLNRRHEDFQSTALPLSYLGMVGAGGIEPPTSALSELRSNRLSYAPKTTRSSSFGRAHLFIKTGLWVTL
jgi:hypothetical protein